MNAQLPPGWPGYVFGIVTIILAFVINWRKGRVDESTLILGKWKEMVTQHAQDIKDLRDELRREREDNAVLRDQLRNALEEADDLRKRLRKAEDKIAGLERKIIQLGRSALNNIVPPDPGAEPAESEALKSLERLDQLDLGRTSKRKELK